MKEPKNVIETENGTCDGCLNCGMGCSCGRMHGYSGHPVLRILLALAIIAFVFTAGVKLGELKEQLGMGYEGSYSHHMMMDRGQDFRVYEGQAMPTTTITAPAPTLSTPPAATTAPAAR